MWTTFTTGGNALELYFCLSEVRVESESPADCMFDNPDLLFDTALFDHLTELSIVRCSWRSLEFTQDHLKFLEKLTLDRRRVGTVACRIAFVDVSGDQGSGAYASRDALLERWLLFRPSIVDFHALESVVFGANSVQKAHITISSSGSWFLRRRLSEAGQS